MSDMIPLPSPDPVDLEILRPFQADYHDLHDVEDKKIFLRLKDLFTPERERQPRLFEAIGLEGRFVMALDDQLIIQLDWALHDIHLDGQTVLTRIVADPPGLNEKALRALRNRLQSRYSVYRLSNLVPDLGVEFEDLIFGGRFAVLDLPTAENRKPGDLMATRIYWTGEYWTHSSGRFFPRPELVPVIRQRVADLVGESLYHDLSATARSRVATAIIRACAEDMPKKDLGELDWGVFNKLKKKTPPGSKPQLSAAVRVGRNDRCPCGSGLKYKRCCCGN